MPARVVEERSHTAPHLVRPTILLAVLTNLERQLQPELDQPRVVHGVADLPERGRRAYIVGHAGNPGQAELRMVEQVEYLGPEIQPHILPGQREPLDHREVGIHKVRSGYRGAVRVAKLTGCGAGKAAGVEPHSEALVEARARVAYLFGPIEV